jgi:hypothetical protein
MAPSRFQSRPQLTMARLHTCTVLQTTPERRQLWQFSAQGNFPLGREQTAPDGDPLPVGLAQKSWSEIWQPKLNVAWLPPDKVFLRVVQLPASTPAETRAMVELQLEKLSPFPVAQVVWSVCPLPPRPDAPATKLQTLVVVLVERKAVEEFLGQLEGQGYLADRLELGVLDQLIAADVSENGAWVYPGAWGRRQTALVAWWFDGTLQNLSTISLPVTGDAANALYEQLTQMTWGAELEGWLTKTPTWTLVADDATMAEWETPLRKALDAPIQVVPPLKPAELAALTARRVARSDGATNLVPGEISTRYRNQFWDSLWLRGGLAVGGLYLLGITIYFAALFVQDFRVSRVEAQVTGMGASYTNAIQLRDRFQVLKTRQELKFAALDCWKVTAELMPENVQLDGFGFVDGRKLTLNGTAAADKVNDVLGFYGAMRKATLKGQPMFDPNKGAELSTTLGPGGTVVNWRFGLELKRTEGE